MGHRVLVPVAHQYDVAFRWLRDDILHVGYRGANIFRRVLTVNEAGLPVRIDEGAEQWQYLSNAWAVSAPIPVVRRMTAWTHRPAASARSAARQSFRIACARTAATIVTVRLSRPNSLGFRMDFEAPVPVSGCGGSLL